MSFKPNFRGPLCLCGQLIVTSAGTAVPLSSNWTPDFNPANPTEPGGGEVPEYSIAFEDMIISAPQANTGGIYLVTYNTRGATGSKSLGDSIILYIPKLIEPISVKKFLGGCRLQPYTLAVDADNDGDSCWVTGIIGT